MSTVPTEAELLKHLRKRYPTSAYAFFTHVANGTGGRIQRTADAVAMSLWPSRGLDLYGFEVKRTRRDWIREYEDPSKAEAIARYCAEWWIVTGADNVVAAEELPKPWGLMTMKGTNLVVIKRPEWRQAEPVDQTFLAALLRAAQNHSSTAAELDAAHREGYEQGLSQGQAARERAERRARELEGLIKEFQDASGVRLSLYGGHQMGHIGAAVRAVLDGDDKVQRYRNTLTSLQASARRLLETIDREVQESQRQTDGEIANV